LSANVANFSGQPYAVEGESTAPVLLDASGHRHPQPGTHRRAVSGWLAGERGAGHLPKDLDAQASTIGVLPGKGTRAA